MVYDAEKANKAIRFIGNLRHAKGRWKGLTFAETFIPWQVDLIKTIYGTVDNEGLRQYRVVYVEVPRKNGKSTLAAAIALKQLCADGENAAEVYSAAGDRDQAAIVFDTAVSLVKATPGLMDKFRIHQSYNIRKLWYGDSVYSAIPANHQGAHGYNASTVILDEAHVQPNSMLYDTLSTSVGSREQPLIFIITTAGDTLSSFCGELHQYAVSVARGEVKDPRFLSLVFSAEPGEDYSNPEVWARVNPSLGYIIREDFIRQEYEDTLRQPYKIPSFRRLYLNTWVDVVKTWIPAEVLHEVKDVQGHYSEYEDLLLGRPCYVGIDLSTTRDLTALSSFFPNERELEAVPGEVEDGAYVLTYPYLPGDDIVGRSRKDNTPYDKWAEAGCIELTPGRVVSYGPLHQRLRWLLDNYQVVAILYDPYNATEFIRPYAEEGLNVIEVRQGALSLSEPAKYLEKLILSNKLFYGGHPVFERNLENAAAVVDTNDNVKIVKKATNKRIDTVAALITAIYGFMHADRNGGDIFFINDDGLIAV